VKHHKPALLVATVLLASIGAVPSAGAAEQTVTMIDLSADTAVAREIAHDVARAIKRNAKLRYRSVDETLNVGGEDVHRSNLRSGAGLYRSALGRIKDDDWEEAAEELESAVASYTESFAFTTDHVHIAEVMVMHGIALYKSKQGRAARKAWVRATEFRPKHKPDLSKYGTAVQKAYTKARDIVMLRDMVTFEVQTKPPHAEVWCNGRYFGLSPAYVKTFKGTAFVAVRKHGYARVGVVKRFKRSGKEISLELADARRKPLFEKLRESMAEVFDGAVERNDLAQARGLLNAGMAVVLRATGTREKMKIQVALANLDGRQVVKRITRDMPWLRRNKKAMEVLIKDLFEAPKIPVGADGPKVKQETVFGKWWFWAGAAAVVGGSVTAYLLLSGDENLKQEYPDGTGGIAIQF